MSSVQFDERAERVAFVHSSREESPNRRDSKMLVALLAMQTVVLIALLCGGVYAYREVIDNANKIDAVVTIVKNPSQLISKPQLVHSLVTLMQNTTGEFFFGSEDGAIPNFINNLMLFDFGSWGLEISNFAADVTNTFEANSNSSLCSQPVQCTPYSEVQCANGDVKWCDYTGQVNCAPVSTCVGPSIVTAASVVASVARRIGEMHQLSGSTDGTAAFSEGVFRMDFLVDWVRSQMSSPNWKDAGEMCRAFVSQVRAVDWKGNYNDANDEFSQWDATEQVIQVTIYVDQVCDGLRQIAEHQRPPVAKKQHRISGQNHHSLP